MSNSGVYLPPSKLRELQRQQGLDVSDDQTQRTKWDELKKNLNSLVNKINMDNIDELVFEQFEFNQVWGRGLQCRAVLQAQQASPAFTSVYACLVNIINSKIPDIGDILLNRLIMSFHRMYKRNDKQNCVSTLKFIGQLVNQQVVQPLLVLELFQLFLTQPTRDSIYQVSEQFKEVGSFLQEASPLGYRGVLDQLRNLLQESEEEASTELDTRSRFVIEGLFELQRKQFENHPCLEDKLDLVELDDIVTHEHSLGEQYEEYRLLDIYKHVPDFPALNKQWDEVKLDILYGGRDDYVLLTAQQQGDAEQGLVDIEGNYSSNGSTAGFGGSSLTDMKESEEMAKLAVRRRVYLTIMSALSPDEVCHKLLSQMKAGEEQETVTMILECCSNEKTYSKFYGATSERLCKLRKTLQDEFEDAFALHYAMIHRYSADKIRNLAYIFAHQLCSNSIPWVVQQYIEQTELQTTSASRIFIKILFTELAKLISMDVFYSKVMSLGSEYNKGILLFGHPKDTRFAVNFLTSIGLGRMTEEMREYQKDAPEILARIAKEEAEREDLDRRRRYSDDSDSEDYQIKQEQYKREQYNRSSSRSSSRSRSPSRDRSTHSRSRDSRSRSPVRDRSRSPLRRSRSRSPPRDRSRSPLRRSRSRSPSRDRSRSPLRRSRSRSPPPPPLEQYSRHTRSPSQDRDIKRTKYE